MPKKQRAFELDALRGLAVICMIFHHLIFDFRYLLELDIFAFQDTTWFYYGIRPIFIMIFVLVSGVCCQFSRNNYVRSAKLLGVSLGFSVVMAIASQISNMEMYIFFNVLHLLTVGTFLYAVISSIENHFLRKFEGNEERRHLVVMRVHAIYLLLTVVLIFADEYIRLFGQNVTGYWLLPLGFLPQQCVGMGDYLPILPWLGVFFGGVVLGRIAYSSRASLFPQANKTVRKVAAPFAFTGRYALWVYIFHQPILLAILFGFRYLGIW